MREEENQREGEEKERECVCLPSTFSLLKLTNSQEFLNSIQIFLHVSDRGLKPLSYHLLPSWVHNKRTLEWKRGSTSSQVLWQRMQFIPPCHNTFLNILFLFAFICNVGNRSLMISSNFCSLSTRMSTVQVFKVRQNLV